MPSDRFPDTIPDATLVIDRSSSTCANCGKGANPSQETHEDIADWTPVPGGGCKIRWTHLSSNYAGRQQKIACVDMRPDLKWVDMFPDLHAHD